MVPSGSLAPRLIAVPEKSPVWPRKTRLSHSASLPTHEIVDAVIVPDSSTSGRIYISMIPE